MELAEETMNKKEAKEFLKNLPYSYLVQSNDLKYVELGSALYVVDKIEPEKPIVPQFVADWIGLSKASGFFLRLAMEHWKMDENMEKWMAHSNNQETFARAWLDGFEIEQEKLYTVEIPDPHGLFEYRYLYKHSNGVTFRANDDDLWKSRSECQLTEAEIKEDFEWAWQWAKPVEE